MRKTKKEKIKTNLINHIDTGRICFINDFRYRPEYKWVRVQGNNDVLYIDNDLFVHDDDIHTQTNQEEYIFLFLFTYTLGWFNNIQFWCRC